MRAELYPYKVAGLKGGLPGQSSEYSIVRTGGTIVRLKSKDAATLEPGDTINILTAVGGGYQDPLERDPVLVKKDIENQFITKEEARRFHAYALD